MHDTSRSAYTVLRRIHTNPLECALDQIASNRVEPIRIRSVHTLVSESEFDYGLRKIYLLASDTSRFMHSSKDAIMDTITPFFRVYKVINYEVLTKLHVQTIASIAHIINASLWRY